MGLSANAEGCRQLTVVEIKKCQGIDNTGILTLAQCSSSISRPLKVTILHVNVLTATALSACRGPVKVKLHVRFKRSLSQTIVNQSHGSWRLWLSMEEQSIPTSRSILQLLDCSSYWQTNMDPNDAPYNFGINGYILKASTDETLVDKETYHCQIYIPLPWRCPPLVHCQESSFTGQKSGKIYIYIYIHIHIQFAREPIA